MSGDRPRSPRRTPHENQRLVTARQGDGALFELIVSPEAGVPDLVAAAGTLPRRVIYTDHRPAAPGDGTAVLVFQSLPSEPAGVQAPPSAGGGPSPVRGWVPDADAVRAGSRRSVLEEALSALLTPAAFGLHGHLLVHGLAHCDPDALVAAAELARRERAVCR